MTFSHCFVSSYKPRSLHKGNPKMKLCSVCPDHPSPLHVPTSSSCLSTRPEHLQSPCPVSETSLCVTICCPAQNHFITITILTARVEAKWGGNNRIVSLTLSLSLSLPPLSVSLSLFLSLAAHSDPGWRWPFPGVSQKSRGAGNFLVQRPNAGLQETSPLLCVIHHILLSVFSTSLESEEEAQLTTKKKKDFFSVSLVFPLFIM